MEIDQEIKNEIEQLATVIVSGLEKQHSVFINIQIEAEYSQYDVLFAYDFMNLGAHQRGILANNLLIGVVGFGTFGFRIEVPDTEPSYYQEKLGVHSNFLAMLFNEVKKRLKESQ